MTSEWPIPAWANWGEGLVYSVQERIFRGRVESIALLLVLILVGLQGVSRAMAQTLEDHLGRAREAYAAGDLAKASELFESLAASSSAASGVRVEALETLGVIARREGRLEDAIRWADRTREAAREAGDPLAEGEALHTRGLAAYALGLHDEAVANVRASLEIHRRAGHRLQEVIRLTNLGGLNQLADRYFEAQREYEAALDRLEGYQDEPWASERKAVVVANLASLYQRLGRYEKALDLYQASRAQSELAAGDRAQLLTNMGALYRRMGDPYKAVEAYAEAEREAAAAGDVARRMTAGVNRGIALALDLGRLEEAEERFSAVQALAKRTGVKRELLHATLYLAETRRRRGRLAEARAAFEDALAQAEALGVSEERWKALYGMGGIAESQGDEARSKQLYEEAIAGVESLRSRLESESLRRGFLADRSEPYAALVGLLIRSPDADRSCARFEHCAELVRRIAAQGSRRPVRPIASENPHEKALRDELAAAWEERLTAAVSHRGPLDLRIERLEADYEAAAGASRRSGQAELAALQQGLEPGAVVLALWRGRDLLLRMWIRRDSARYEVAALGAPERQTLRRFRDALSDPAEDWAEAAERAGELLLGDSARREAASASTIWILGNLAAEALPLEAAIPVGGSEPWIALVPIAYLGNWEAPRRRGPSWTWPWMQSYAALAYSQPEPGSGQPALQQAAAEAREVAAQLPGSGTVLLEEQASLEGFTEALEERPPVLHLAAHAVLDEERPELSRLLLAPSEPGSDRPGVALLAAIERLPLNGVRLVTLSACDTARGQAAQGDGVRSLGMAFLNAGAESAVAGVWRVPDAETAALMQQFYHRLGRGEDPAAALRAAKLKLLRSGRGLHPYYWAGFQLVSRTSGPVVRPVPWAALALALGALAIVGGLGVRARAK